MKKVLLVVLLTVVILSVAGSAFACPPYYRGQGCCSGYVHAYPRIVYTPPVYVYPRYFVPVYVSPYPYKPVYPYYGAPRYR